MMKSSDVNVLIVNPTIFLVVSGLVHIPCKLIEIEEFPERLAFKAILVIVS